MEISSIYLIRVKERDIEEIENKQYSVIVKSVPKVMEKKIHSQIKAEKHILRHQKLTNSFQP